MPGPVARRPVLAGLLGTAAVGASGAAEPATAGAATGRPGGGASSRVYLGAYTGNGGARGLGVTHTAAPKGSLVLDAVVATASPSFLALSPTAPVLYAANETDNGRISAFALAEDGGVLGPAGGASSGGAGPCHLAVHPLGGHLFTANYNSGTLGVLALAEDGSPDGLTQTVRHTGSGPHPGRQTGPHAHMVLPTADGRRLFAVDLGTDSVHTYDFDAGEGQLTPVHESKTAPGSGPRHLAFHPSGRTAYVLGELDSTLTTCGYDPATGALTPLATVSVLPQDTAPEANAPAEVLVSADGRFVYTSNRGHDSIAVFTAEGAAETEPRPLAHYSCGGRGPRHMAFGARERLLYVANQDSASVTALRRDPATGALTSTRQSLTYPQVVCVLPAGG